MRTRAAARVATGILAAGMASSALFHWIAASVFHLPYPWSTFLYRPDFKHTDFGDVWELVRSLHPYSGGNESSYLPFGNIPILWLAGFKYDRALDLLQLLMAASGFAWIWSKARALPTASRTLVSLLAGVLSYPVLFLIDRGNTEVFIFCFLALFVREIESRRGLRAAGWLGAAVAMKFVPIVYLPLLLRDRKEGWKHALAAIAVAAALTIASLAIFEGSLIANWEAMARHMGKFESGNLGSPAGLQHNSSLWAAWREIAGTLMGAPSEWVARTAFVYRAVAIAAFLPISAAIFFGRTALWEAVLLATIAYCALPFVSFDYKLVQFLLPLGLLLDFTRTPEGEKDRRAAALIGIALLLVPKDFWILHDDVSINGMINALIMIWISWELSCKIFFCVTRGGIRQGF